MAVSYDKAGCFWLKTQGQECFKASTWKQKDFSETYLYHFKDLIMLYSRILVNIQYKINKLINKGKIFIEPKTVLS